MTSPACAIGISSAVSVGQDRQVDDGKNDKNIRNPSHRMQKQQQQQGQRRVIFPTCYSIKRVQKIGPHIPLRDEKPSPLPSITIPRKCEADGTAATASPAIAIQPVSTSSKSMTKTTNTVRCSSQSPQRSSRASMSSDTHQTSNRNSSVAPGRAAKPSPSRSTSTPTPTPTRKPTSTKAVNPAKETKPTFPTRATPPRAGSLSRNQSMPLPDEVSKKEASTLVSILRQSTLGAPKVNLGSLPSLKSLKDEEESSQSSSEVNLTVTQAQKSMRRSVSEPTRKVISFDPRIWIREFLRTEEEKTSTWYKEEDMERFKRQALALIMAKRNHDAAHIIATGTPRTFSLQKQNRPVSSSSSVFFTHAALSVEAEDDPIKAMRNDTFRAVVAQNEFRHFLLVDPHDICLTLFAKALKVLFPNAEVDTATSSNEALDYLSTGRRYDIILVEERLQPLFHKQTKPSFSKVFRNDHCHSGSAFLKTLPQIRADKRSLLIGVSAHLEKDFASLEASGADLCWPKPPPKMNSEIRNLLLKRILIKRGRAAVAEDIFDSL